MINLPKLILASGSPRRAEILTSVGWEFEKHVPNIDESELPGETAGVYVRRLAAIKAEAIAQRFPGRLVLGADTTVVIDNEIIGKPADLGHAREMLGLLSGKWHDVLTGIAIANGSETAVAAQLTRVKFALLSAEAIEFLAVHGSPLDKAGAYAVQAQAALFIEAIEGDYWNVVGLPVNLVYETIRSKFSEQ